MRGAFLTRNSAGLARAINFANSPRQLDGVFALCLISCCCLRPRPARQPNSPCIKYADQRHQVGAKISDHNRENFWCGCYPVVARRDAPLSGPCRELHRSGQPVCRLEGSFYVVRKPARQPQQDGADGGCPRKREMNGAAPDVCISHSLFSRDTHRSFIAWDDTSAT